MPFWYGRDPSAPPLVGEERRRADRRAPLILGSIFTAQLLVSIVVAITTGKVLVGIIAGGGLDVILLVVLMWAGVVWGVRSTIRSTHRARSHAD